MNKIYDKNLSVEKDDCSDAVWYDVKNSSFKLYGFADSCDILSTRIPQRIAQRVSDGVLALSTNAAGGRVRFSTNSKKIALRVQYRNCSGSVKNTAAVNAGFDLYVSYKEKSEVYLHSYIPYSYDVSENTVEYNYVLEDNLFIYDDINDGFYNFTLYFPCFSEVRQLYIGIDEGSIVKEGLRYRNEKPIVFYGSSITHGACAGRPGNTYESFLSQKYNIDYINLGFAGNAKGEPEMAEYITDLDMSMFVCDYDHNAPTIEHLIQTYQRFYQIVRGKNPNIPYVMVSRPNIYLYPEAYRSRRDFIRDFHNKMKLNGDKNVYFIDGYNLLDGEFAESCTADGCHPNDLGFYRMANQFGFIFEKIFDRTLFIRNS